MRTPGMNRREFFKQAAGTIGVAQVALSIPAAAEPEGEPRKQAQRSIPDSIEYPRRFRGRQLKMISFPLGGVAAGSIGLGGRGQLRDWEIFNRPNQGFRPRYAFPSIWVKAGGAEPMVRVLEARLLPPFAGQDGLGSDNVPGLSRLEGAVFTGSYPLAHIDFEDRTLPAQVELDAFSPFIPHEPDDSGLPVAILRYRVSNSGMLPLHASIAFSIENPIVSQDHTSGAPDRKADQRTNAFVDGDRIAGLLMTNASLAPVDPMNGSIALGCLTGATGKVSRWGGWPKGRWWNSPLLFWDRLSKAGDLGEPPDSQSLVGALCLQKTILPGHSEEFPFLLGWHFPNRTPQWCGWDAPPGDEKTLIGNFYAVRFKNAWDAVTYAAKNLESLEARTRAFETALRKSTLPGAVKDAASANLSTLATTTCFRTADGEFHGFEGSNDTRGCCFGNCTHVWNYETATPFLFPTFARSLRKSAFGYSMDDAGAMHFRQLLPDGKARSGFAAADGQMGQIIHAWLDWKLCGDDQWLCDLWPRVKKAMEFAWVPGGWDAGHNGVLEGVQHNTYDVEFYGPNPLCSIYYLGALRAAGEMATAAGDNVSAQEYQRLFEKGSRWIDANLFNGEFYIQRIKGFKKNEIAPSLQGGMGTENPEAPDYQVGGGCLADQLIGQYLAEVGGMGPLVSADNIRKTLRSIYQYNYKPSLVHHDSVQRTYALNDEAAVVVCDYGKAERPQIPFPYYAESWTGQEYLVAALMMNWGMVEEGVECVTNIRARYDGEKRNPWDEPECGHHYARAMSSWSTVVALSGFVYDGAKNAVVATPRILHDHFDCFWASGTGWGTFAYRRRGSGTLFKLEVIEGSLRCRSCEIFAAGTVVDARRGAIPLHANTEQRGERLLVGFSESFILVPGSDMQIEVRA
jgi:uncharacterized protein (DUF608 family)